MDAPLFTDNQVHELGIAILGGLGLIGAAIRQGFRRYEAAFTEMAAGFKSVVEKISTQTETIIKLESVVEEGRDDIRELARRIPARRTSTNPAIRPRAPGDDQ